MPLYRRCRAFLYVKNRCTYLGGTYHVSTDENCCMRRAAASVVIGARVAHKPILLAVWVSRTSLARAVIETCHCRRRSP